MQNLSIGQEVWGYTSVPHTVTGTEYQEYGSVTMIAPMRYRAKIAGRADGTGWEDYYSSQSRAMVAVGLPLNQEFTVTSQEKGIFRVGTAFDVVSTDVVSTGG